MVQSLSAKALVVLIIQLQLRRADRGRGIREGLLGACGKIAYNQIQSPLGARQT